MVSYWLNYQLSGQETFSYHATNVLLHVANAILVFFIVRKILDFARVEASRRNILADEKSLGPVSSRLESR